MYSEERLNLSPRWFSGSEWSDGTAEYQLGVEYEMAVAREDAIEAAKTPAQKAREKRVRDKKKFQKWFEWKLSQEGKSV